VSTGPSSKGAAAVYIVLYVVARLALVAALSAAIYGIARLLGIREFPLPVALLFALVIAMPLGMWLFGSLRRRATAALASANERRRRDREQLQARLRGEMPADGE
jgi:hypothetical protein